MILQVYGFNMIQMRWLLKDEFGYDGMDTKKVLQYRYRRKIMDKRKVEDLDKETWSPWINVPTVEEQYE